MFYCGLTPFFNVEIQLITSIVSLFFCLDAKEPKNQGCETLGGGFFSYAAQF